MGPLSKSFKTLKKLAKRVVAQKRKRPVRHQVHRGSTVYWRGQGAAQDVDAHMSDFIAGMAQETYQEISSLSRFSNDYANRVYDVMGEALANVARQRIRKEGKAITEPARMRLHQDIGFATENAQRQIGEACDDASKRKEVISHWMDYASRLGHAATKD